jgi:hypothetical protein
LKLLKTQFPSPHRYYNLIESQDSDTIQAPVCRLKAFRLDVVEDTRTPKKSPLNVERGVYSEATGRPSLTGFGYSLLSLFRVILGWDSNSAGTKGTHHSVFAVFPKPRATWTQHLSSQVEIQRLHALILACKSADSESNLQPIVIQPPSGSRSSASSSPSRYCFPLSVRAYTPLP